MGNTAGVAVLAGGAAVAVAVLVGAVVAVDVGTRVAVGCCAITSG